MAVELERKLDYGRPVPTPQLGHAIIVFTMNRRPHGGIPFMARLLESRAQPLGSFG